MCGIFGRIGSPEYSDVDYDWIVRLALLSQSRGEDATGFAFINDVGELRIRKAAMAARHFIRSKMFTRKYVNESRIILGHTRHATMGDKDKDTNAHPFRFGHIAGVHNGVIHNPSDAFNGKSPEVDSHAVFEVLRADGWSGLRRLRGSMSIAYYDSKADVVGLYTNTGDLHIRRFNGCLYFASSEKFLPNVEKDVVGDVPVIRSTCYNVSDDLNPVVVEVATPHTSFHTPPIRSSAPYCHGYAEYDRDDFYLPANTEKLLCRHCKSNRAHRRKTALGLVIKLCYICDSAIVEGEAVCAEASRSMRSSVDTTRAVVVSDEEAVDIEREMLCRAGYT